MPEANPNDTGSVKKRLNNVDDWTRSGVPTTNGVIRFSSKISIKLEYHSMPLGLMGSSRPPRGIIRDQEIEKRYDLTPYLTRRATSSFQSLYESVATSPFRPSRVLPGWLENSSQIDLPLPSTSVDPSIW